MAKQPKPGDRQIMAHCLVDLPEMTDCPGEADWNRATYQNFGPFTTIKEAADYSNTRSLVDNGAVVVYEWKKQHPGRWGWSLVETWADGGLMRKYDDEW